MNKNPLIAAKFMLAAKYEDYARPPLALCMPKLNGIRAMYVPGAGFFSRDGVQYSPAVVSHIKVHSSFPVDGEFYVHGWELQRINAAIGVNLDQPVADTAAVRFHIFDVLSPMDSADRRRGYIPSIVADGENLVEVDQRLLQYSQFDANFDAHVRAGYEGQMLKLPFSPYTAGRTPRLLKRKDWKYIDATVVEIFEGLGELGGMFGGALVEPAAGVRFNVGCGKGLTHEERIRIWRNPSSLLGRVVKVKYIFASADNKPLNATVVL